MVVPLMLAVVLSASNGGVSARSGLSTLGTDFDPLRRQFNDDDSKVRVLALLSPTAGRVQTLNRPRQGSSKPTAPRVTPRAAQRRSRRRLRSSTSRIRNGQQRCPWSTFANRWCRSRVCAGGNAGPPCPAGRSFSGLLIRGGRNRAPEVHPLKLDSRTRSFESVRGLWLEGN